MKQIWLLFYELVNEDNSSKFQSWWDYIANLGYTLNSLRLQIWETHPFLSWVLAYSSWMQKDTILWLDVSAPKNVIKNEPWHGISNNVVWVTSKASDQPAHTRSLIRAFASPLNFSISVKLLTEHDLEFLSLKGDCTGSSESTLVKMPHCWKSHAVAQMFFFFTFQTPPNLITFDWALERALFWYNCDTLYFPASNWSVYGHVMPLPTDWSDILSADWLNWQMTCIRLQDKSQDGFDWMTESEKWIWLDKVVKLSEDS